MPKFGCLLFCYVSINKLREICLYVFPNKIQENWDWEVIMGQQFYPRKNTNKYWAITSTLPTYPTLSTHSVIPHKELAIDKSAPVSPPTTKYIRPVQTIQIMKTFEVLQCRTFQFTLHNKTQATNPSIRNLKNCCKKLPFENF